MEPCDYDKIALCKILYFVRGAGLLAEYSRWGRTIDQKMVAVHGSPCAPTPLILIVKVKQASQGRLLFHGVSRTVSNLGYSKNGVSFYQRLMTVLRCAITNSGIKAIRLVGNAEYRLR
jgi:hypothetical protein